jgi:hypothetical protein
MKGLNEINAEENKAKSLPLRMPRDVYLIVKREQARLNHEKAEAGTF